MLRLRKDLELFANLRPAICFKELANASTLKPEIVSDLDIMIVRELTGGIYFGSPRGVEKLSNGEKKGINTHTYTTSEIQRVARVAFELARKRNNKVTSCEKSNVMEAGLLWREVVEELHKKEFNGIKVCPTTFDNMLEYRRIWNEIGKRPPGNIRKHFSEYVQQIVEQSIDNNQITNI